MRRVRNQNIHSASPALMFASGVESIVSEHLANPRRNDEGRKDHTSNAPPSSPSRAVIFSAC